MLGALGFRSPDPPVLLVGVVQVLQRLAEPAPGGLPSVVVCHSEPGAWDPALFQTSRCPPRGYPAALYVIGRTMFETDRVTAHHVQACARLHLDHQIQMQNESVPGSGALPWPGCLTYASAKVEDVNNLLAGCLVKLFLHGVDPSQYARSNNRAGFSAPWVISLYGCKGPPRLDVCSI